MVMESKLHERDEDAESDGRVPAMDMDETMILHRASGILRKSMANIKNANSYASVSDIETESIRKYVPDNLYNFICWTTNKTDYDNVTSESEKKSKPNLKVLSICHNIIAHGQKIRTPLTMATTVHIHHSVGSKQLIDIMYNLGHGVSYDELRRFLTSVAKDQISQSAGVYIPRGIQKVTIEVSNTIVDAAIDNFDQNEETLDGKGTTHSMAVVLYQRCGVSDANNTNIPRTTQKTLDVTDYDEKEICRYPQPSQKPEPTAVTDDSFLKMNTAVTSKSKRRDLLWELLRFAGRDTNIIPAWSGFNAVTTLTNVPVATIRYLPFIHAPPTDLSTIYTTLLQLVAVVHQLGQSHIIVTADLAIYCKAQQILWSKPQLLVGQVTMRLGGMHYLMAVIASIGKLFGDGGLLDLLTVTEVYADATARQMLQGKQLNRAVRGLKLMHEALTYLLITSAKSWCETNSIEWMDKETAKGLADLQHTFRAKDHQSSIDITKTMDTSGVMRALQQFQYVGISQSATFAFWINFLEMAQIMMRLLRAERNADFDLHLEAVCEAIPYFFVGGRNNYAKYAQVYIADMKQLQIDQPDFYKHLQNGGFVIRRTTKHFNCVPTDQALEQTVNRDAKSHGGVIGFTLRKGALLRWLITRPVTGSYSEAMKLLCAPQRATTHQDLGQSRLARDSADVEKIVDAIVLQYHNPFDLETVPSSLIKIVTGQVASREVEESLTTLEATGRSQMIKFAEKRLLQKTRSTSFWEPQSRTKIKTFADMRKSLPSVKDKKMMCSSEVLFRRLLSVSNARDIDMKIVLQHELAAVAPALFNDDGTMRKINKSDLASKLESVCPEVHTLPDTLDEDQITAYIIDGMAVFQSMNESLFNTFDDLAAHVMKKVLRLLNDSKLRIGTVVLVYDRYDRYHSIKKMERTRRGTGDNTPSHIIVGSRNVPNYRLFLQGAANKSALAAFVCEYIALNAPSHLGENKSILLAGGFADGKVVKSLRRTGVVMVPPLFSSHEEADTRMVLHAIDLSATCTRIIIQCDDTDVLVILL